MQQTATRRPTAQTAAEVRAADPLYDRKDAALYLGVVPGTLECWASTGRYNLPFLRIGRRVKYRKSDLDAWIAKRSPSAA
ncbi:helix-turn-helix domain-containing protein [Thiocapsa rosea]|uniref:Excisionase family DNA binding protein n=1 Tax=Thiocapsa rosea TaxID=69360 RepID=A0A495VF77_9GAMM|nr:helix-turn-helix domain-containing protein [Thiocapsa rosea]RKT47490.1 excisionase family DNA binding protein [Thiocapsa rosea]